MTRSKLLFTFLSAMLLLPLYSREFAVTPSAPEFRIAGQQNQTVEFTLKQPLKKGEFLNLTFDGFLQFKRYGGYDCCLSITLNGKTIAGENLLNVPEMFLRNNGMSSISFHWRFNRFYLLYAPSLAAAQSSNCQYRPQDWNGTTYRFDISKYVKPGKNTLTFSNGQPVNVHKLLHDNTPIPAVISNIKIFKVNSQPKPAEEWWVTELKELNKNPRYIEPRKNTAEKFTCNVDKTGKIVIKSGKAVYHVDTFFSYPNGGYNSLGINHREKAEKEFTVSQQVNGNSIIVNAGGKFYTIKREITKHHNYISVKDTLTNLTDKAIGVIVRSRLVPAKGKAENIMIHGLPVKTHSQIHSPENASAFMAFGDGGCAIVPNDDILQFQAHTYVNNNVCGLNNPSLVLQGKKSVTLEFEIYPIEKGDMFTFLNNARDNWKLNGIETSKGKRAMLWHKDHYPRLSKRWQSYEDAIGQIYINHWSSQSDKGAVCKWGWAVTQDKEMLAHRKELFELVRKNYPLKKKVPIYYAVMAPYASNHPEHLDDKLFKDWIVINGSGVKLTECGYRYFILTKDNGPGKGLRKLVDIAIDEWKCDGLFFDYLEGANPYYTYVRSDGISGDINPKTKLLGRQKASYQLLSQDYIIDLMRYIVNERKLPVVGNRSFYTRTTREALKDLIPMRFGEAGSLCHVARNYFAPVPNSLQRTYRNVHKQFLSALYLGVVPQEYDFAYNWTDCPDTACYPIAIDELHRGYVLGTNKIITAISGDFSFGDGDQVKVSRFNFEGRRIPANFEIVKQNGKTVTRVRLNYGEIAVIDRVK